MNKRYFKVDEDTLQNLLYRAWRLDCLESDGVDNWEWYMEGAQEMINEFLESHPDIECEDPYDFYFDDCARYELEHDFEEIK